jgi:hypothetical protein
VQWIVEPAAEGRTELAPTTDAGRDDVRRHAPILAEAANLLMLPGRAAGPDWIAYAQALRTTGRQASCCPRTSRAT